MEGAPTRAPLVATLWGDLAITCTIAMHILVDSLEKESKNPEWGTKTRGFRLLRRLLNADERAWNTYASFDAISVLRNKLVISASTPLDHFESKLAFIFRKLETANDTVSALRAEVHGVMTRCSIATIDPTIGVPVQL